MNIIEQVKQAAVDACQSVWEEHRAGAEFGNMPLAISARMALAWQDMPRTPTIVCLCGSTRFYAAFQEANYRETMAGNIVLSVGFYPHSSEQAHGETIGITPAQKEALDHLHLRKVAMADEVLILNVDQYIGPSTAGELAYARSLGKTIRFLEEPLI